MSDLDRLRSIDNLKRAWRWIQSNPDANYKSYFRHLYRNYSAAEDALLEDLADRLRRQVYQPIPACKLFYPKPSGILRPYSLLTVQDQIVYQASANLVAEKLFPRVKHRYYKQVFGHLYAGKTSIWFYRKWSEGYKQFNDAARKSYADGLTFSASFDLTAYYDSIDYRVLRHFLEKIGLDVEFCQQLTEWLAKWTATERNIIHNHGIPQGPLSSGLLSEVVLQHFDELKLPKVSYQYFRYVDDIRLFAKSEHDLRRILVELDLRSKDIGLFPQSTKISIHKVFDIELELKTVSNPPEPSIKGNIPDQEKLFKRIVELTPKYSIKDPTRFKYLLSHATPKSQLTERLWRIYDKHPDIYKSFCNYLRRYKRFPKIPAEKIVEEVKQNTLYQSVKAEFISVAVNRLPREQEEKLGRFLKTGWTPRSLHPDLLVRSAQFLISNGRLTDRQIIYACGKVRPWWARATLIEELSFNNVAANTLKNILDEQIMDEARDVALEAGWKSFISSIHLSSPRGRWNPAGGKLLKSLGVIQRNTATYCGIQKSMEKLAPGSPVINWKSLFGTHYQQAEIQAVEIVSLAGTNITAFVNALDVFNDILLDAIFSKDGTIGKYTLGKIGSVLTKNNKLDRKFPNTFTLAYEVHEARYQSMYSHARVKSTAKPTRKIGYRFLGKAKKLLLNAIIELNVAII